MKKHRLGELNLISLDDGAFRLDGGSMYGIVPRVLWQDASPPDSQNRIGMRARPLLVQGPFGNLLIEAGLGDVGDAVFRERYAVAEPRGLVSELAALGLVPEAIDYVAMTHLHWDHAAGLVGLDEAGRLKPTFPRAIHFIQEDTWQAALRPGPRAGSFLPDRLEPLAGQVRLEWIHGEAEILPGVTLRPAGGHCEAHSLVMLASGDETAVFLGDLVPLASHFRTLWIMAFDMWPVKTVEAKKALMAEACAGGWLQVLYHDDEHAFGRLRRDERDRIQFDPA